MLINHLDVVARVIIIIIVIVIKFSVHFTVSPYCYFFFFVYPSFTLDVFNNYCLTLCSSY